MRGDSVYGRTGYQQDDSKILCAVDLEFGLVPTETKEFRTV